MTFKVGGFGGMIDLERKELEAEFSRLEAEIEDLKMVRDSPERREQIIEKTARSQETTRSRVHKVRKAIQSGRREVVVVERRGRFVGGVSLSFVQWMQQRVPHHQLNDGRTSYRLTLASRPQCAFGRRGLREGRDPGFGRGFLLNPFPARRSY